MEIVLRQHVLQRASTHIASSGSIDFSHFETAAGHHSRTAYLLGGSRWSRRGAYLRTDIRIVEDVVVTSHPLANHVRKGSGLKDHAGRASRTITAIVKQVLPQRHLVVQGTRALRAAGAFTGRTDLNVTSCMDSGTLANLGKLSLPETLTKKGERLSYGAGDTKSERRRVAQDSPPFFFWKAGKTGRATDAHLHFEVHRQLVPLSDQSL